jgi:hypothetical protein
MWNGASTIPSSDAARFAYGVAQEKASSFRHYRWLLSPNNNAESSVSVFVFGEQPSCTNFHHCESLGLWEIHTKQVIDLRSQRGATLAEAERWLAKLTTNVQRTSGIASAPVKDLRLIFFRLGPIGAPSCFFDRKKLWANCSISLATSSSACSTARRGSSTKPV